MLSETSRDLACALSSPRHDLDLGEHRCKEIWNRPSEQSTGWCRAIRSATIEDKGKPLKAGHCMLSETSRDLECGVSSRSDDLGLGEHRCKEIWNRPSEQSTGWCR